MSDEDEGLRPEHLEAIRYRADIAAQSMRKQAKAINDVRQAWHERYGWRCRDDAALQSLLAPPDAP